MFDLVPFFLLETVTMMDKLLPTCVYNRTSIDRIVIVQEIEFTNNIFPIVYLDIVYTCDIVYIHVYLDTVRLR